MGLTPASSFIATIEMTVWHTQAPLKGGGFPMPRAGRGKAKVLPEAPRETEL